MIKKIIRKDSRVFEVKGHAKPDTIFEKGKGYFVGDSIYLYWGEITLEEHKNWNRAGFYHCEEVSPHVMFNSTGVGDYVYDAKDIEDVDTERLSETIKLFENELYKYIEIQNAVSDSQEALFKVSGNIETIKLMSVLSAMLNKSSKTIDRSVEREALNLQFKPSHVRGSKITRNGNTPKMLFTNHTEKILNDNFRYQFYDHK